MTKKIKFVLVPVLIVLTIALVTCKPIEYYLERVYKVYGRVTEAETGRSLESVEVFIRDFQYSELTNGHGDYELELAAGTWTLDFISPMILHESASVVVTVGPDTPRVKADLVVPRRYYDCLAIWEFRSADDGSLLESIAFDVDLASEEAAFDWIGFWFSIHELSMQSPVAVLGGTVCALSDSRIDIRLGGVTVLEDGSYNDYGPGTGPYSQMIAMFYGEGLSDNVNVIYFPYTISGDQMTAKVPVGSGFEEHVFLRTGPAY